MNFFAPCNNRDCCKHSRKSTVCLLISNGWSITNSISPIQISVTPRFPFISKPLVQPSIGLFSSCDPLIRMSFQKFETHISIKIRTFAPELARRHVCVVSQKEKRSKKEKLKMYKRVLRTARNGSTICNTFL